MLLLGLTGGIGAGKSTVAAMLADLGARVVDGDAIARSLVAGGEPALEAIVAAFGAQVLLADGELDRPALAAVVFGDEAELARLDAIMHPRISERAGDLLASAAAQGVAVGVYDMPLLTENAAAHTFDLVIAVTAPLATRLARLAERGVAPQDARRRMSRQATDAQRAEVADVILDNSGDRRHLQDQVLAVWARLAELHRSGPDGPPAPG